VQNHGKKKLVLGGTLRAGGGHSLPEGGAQVTPGKEEGQKVSPGPKQKEYVARSPPFHQKNNRPSKEGAAFGERNSLGGEKTSVFGRTHRAQNHGWGREGRSAQRPGPGRVHDLTGVEGLNSEKECFYHRTAAQGAAQGGGNWLASVGNRFS